MIGLERERLVAVARYRECHEDVTRGGISQPCEKIAVAIRLDPTEGEPYPVCAYHARSPMVPIAYLAAAFGVPA